MTAPAAVLRAGGPDDAISGVLMVGFVVLRSAASCAMRVSKALRDLAICSTCANCASTSTSGPSSSMTSTATAPAG